MTPSRHKAAALAAGLLILLSLPLPAAALDAMPPGSLKAFALSSTNPRDIERWSAHPEDQDAPLLLSTHFHPGETAYAAVLVTGYARNAANQVDLDASFRFHDTDGKLLFRRDAFARIQRTVTTADGFLLLDPALDVAFDPGDQPGKYLLEFEVNDNVNHRRTRTRLNLILGN